MKQFISFVKKEIQHILRDKRTMLILFGMPIVLMLLFGFAITNDVKNVRTVVVTSQLSPMAQQAVEQLTASDYFTIVATVPTPKEAELMIRRQKADFAVVFAPRRQGVQFIVDGSDPNMAQQWTVYAQQTMSVVQGSQLSNERSGMVDYNVQGSSDYSNLSTQTYSPSQERTPNTILLYNPRMKSAYNFVPAIMGMLLLLICAMMTSVSIVREKERGTMEILLVSPVRPLMIIVAKAVPYLLQSVFILVVILVMSVTLLDVPLESSIGWIVLVSIIYILLALSLGLLISNIAKTQFVALLVSAMVMLLPTVMLSGMLFPVESMPTILQCVSAIIPPRYYISAMRKLMIMGVGIESVWREVAVLCIMTTVLLTIALRKFKTRLE